MANNDNELTRTQAPVNTSGQTGDFAPRDIGANDATVGAPQHGIETPGGKSVAGYDLISTVGRGGMGVVYKAKHQQLNRVVALKMTLGGAHAHPVERMRFLTEAEVVGSLAHPNIVPVYEFGTHEGQPYYTMEFLGGGSLADKVKEGPMPARMVAEMVQKLAMALDLAHAKGVVHRDLKPGNILFADDGTPKVVDFGLARQASSELTATQAVLGTPSYMAPEQAMGKARDVGPSTDVYALGAILYACLTGRPPFEGETAAETIERVKDSEPTSPRSIISGVPRDLETICLKCLNKEPHRRYNSAGSLAEDLRRFVNGEPITARRVNVFERALRWAIRKPTQAGLVAACLSLVFLGTILGVTLWAASTFKEQNKELTKALETAAVAQKQTEMAKENEAQARKIADTAREAAEKAKENETDARKKMERLSYFRQVDLAHREWQAGELSRASLYLKNCQPELRQWEWNYVNNVVKSEEKSFDCKEGAKQILPCPDGKHFAILGQKNPEVAVYNYATGRQVFHTPGGRNVVFDGSGKYLAITGGHAEIVIFDWAKSKVTCSFNPGQFLAIDIAFHPKDSQKLLVLTTNQIFTYNLNEIAEAPRAFEIPKRRGPPGRQTQGQGKRPPEPGEELKNRFTKMTLHSSGEYLLLEGAETSDMLFHMPGMEEIPIPRNAGWQNFTCAAFDPSVPRLIRGNSFGVLEIWSLKGKTITLEEQVKTNMIAVKGISISPTGETIATIASDLTIRIYNSKLTGEPVQLRGPTSAIQDIALLPLVRNANEPFSPSQLNQQEQLQLVASSLDGQVKGWRLPHEPEIVRVPDPLRQNGLPSYYSLNYDGTKVAFLAGQSSVIRIISTADGRSICPSIAIPPFGVMQLQLSDDSKLLHVIVRDRITKFFGREGLTAGEENIVANVRTYNAETGKLLAEKPLGTGQPVQAMLSADSKYILLNKIHRYQQQNQKQNYQVQRSVFEVFERETGKQIINSVVTQNHVIWAINHRPENNEFQCLTSEGTQYTFSPTGEAKRILSLGAATQMDQLSYGDDFRYDPTGDILVRYNAKDSLFSVRNLKENTRLTVKSDHVGAVQQILIHPDGNRFVSVGTDAAIKVWDIRTGEPVLTVRTKFAIRSVQFTRDGKKLFASLPGSGLVYFDGTLRAAQP